jgi:hypothetical protein
MARELLEHVIEEADAGIDVVFPVAVEIERDEDVGLLGLALDGRYAAFAFDLHGPVSVRGP